MAQNFDKEKMETKKTLNQLTAQIDDLEKVCNYFRNSNCWLKTHLHCFNQGKCNPREN